MKNKVLKTIKENNLICQNDKIVIGVSGGADSVALLDILMQLKEKLNLTILVAHINHNIREEAKDDELFVKNLCKRYNIPFYLKSVNIEELAKSNKISEEEAGRNVRYNFFYELAGENGKIATAHHLNDNIETVIMKFVRGTSLEGLSGMDYKNGNIVRPFLDITRNEIEEYINFNNLSFVSDKTNFKPIYTRNKIRLELIPYIKENLNIGLENSLSDAIKLYNEDNDYFNKESEKLLKLHGSIENNKFSIDKNLLLNTHKSLSSRMIIKMFITVIGQYTVINKRTIDNIFKLLSNNKGSLNIKNNIIAEVQNNTFSIYEYKEKEIIDKNITYKININETKQIGKFTINCSIENKKNIVNNGEVIYLPYEQYKNSEFVFKYRKTGDVFQKNELSKTTLKKYLTKKKVSSDESSLIPMLYINDKCYWVPSKFGSHFSNRSGTFIKFEIQKGR